MPFSSSRRFLRVVPRWVWQPVSSLPLPSGHRPYRLGRFPTARLASAFPHPRRQDRARQGTPPISRWKIDRRGYKLLVRPCRFSAARTADNRRDDRLQVLQNVPLLYGLRLLMPLVIESVTARLQLAGLHAPVGTFGYDGRPRKEQLAADPAQVEAPLVAWRPAEERRGIPIRPMRPYSPMPMR